MYTSCTMKFSFLGTSEILLLKIERYLFNGKIEEKENN